MSDRTEQVPAQNPDDPEAGGTELSDESLETAAGGLKRILPWDPIVIDDPIVIEPPIVIQPIEPIICPLPPDAQTL